MAKTAEKTAAAKGRETKLNKKSHEELIEIILRKDKTERNLNTQISNLKGEVNSLLTRIVSAEKDMDGTIKELKNLHDSNKTKQETIDGIRIKLNDITAEYDNASKELVEFKNKYKELKKIIWTLVGFTILCAVGWLFC